MTKLKLLTVFLLTCVTLRAFAIEGIQITIPSTNAVLSWPSDPSESYIIQYRHTLSATDTWQTLADQYPPDYSGSNMDYFVDTNRVEYGYTYGGDTNSGGGGGMIPNPTNSATGTNHTISVPGTGFYQVVRDGVHLIGISNDMVLTGIVKIPVELGNAAGNVVSLNISEDESPVGDSIQSVPVGNPHLLTLNTTLMASGTHIFYGSGRWEDTNGGLWEANSPAFSVTVSNEVSFENWMPNFGELDNTLLIRATSIHTNTDWQVDVYNTTNAYIGSFSGHTYDGDIQVVWDLFDGSGHQHTNDDSFKFKVSTQYIDPPAPPTYKQKEAWTTSGAWVFGVQHAFDGLTDHDLLYEELNGFLGGASSYWTVRPTPNGGNPFAIPFETFDEASKWATFKSALFNTGSRNLCYFGHGGPNGIGYNQYDTNVSISVPEIGRLLHTIPAGQTNRHAFRFVFLDGCSTAKGTLPEAFGILHKANVPLIDYYNASMRPSCFCGWSADKAVGFAVGSVINYDHVNFISHIQEDMFLNGDTIGLAISYAARQPDVSSVFTSEFKLFGCPDITFGAFNN